MRKIFFFSLFALFITPVFYASAQSVDLLWQGETYTPPFYYGKREWSKQSSVTLVAVPQNLGNPANLNYKWTKNGTVLGSLSGIGRNSLKFADPLFSKPQRVEVEIISPFEEVLARSAVTLTPTSPGVLVYEKNPLLGYMFHKAVGGGYFLKEGEVTFAAFPLFSSPALREGDHITYRWRTNSGESEMGPQVTYRVPDGGQGSSIIDLTLTHNSKILENISKRFLVQFGE